MLYLLSIETSCDDTSMAIMDINNRRILSHISFNQNRTHKEYGGIIPYLASNEHMINIVDIFFSLFETIKIKIFNLQFVIITNKPGLISSLVVGINFGIGIGKSLNIPVIGIDHLTSHLASVFTKNFNMFFIGLIISGGHSSLLINRNKNILFYIGKTKDDAIGESFDKIGRILGLAYPSGRIIDNLSYNGYYKRFIYPLPFFNKKTFYFSFSGLKSFSYKLINLLINNSIIIKKNILCDICSSLQQILIMIALEKSYVACCKYSSQHLVVGGGVASNFLFTSFCYTLKKHYDIKIYCPQMPMCTDNAIMVAQNFVSTFF